MAAPTLIASYSVNSASIDTTDLVTPAFTPSSGEVIVVKLATWDTGNPMGTVSGGGQTYTTRVTAAPGGFAGWARIVTAVISGSPGSMTVTGAGTATNSTHSMVVERWSGQLAASPAVNSTVSGSGAPSANITTAGANSAVSWVSVDVASQDPASRTYRLSATEDGLRDGHVGANSVQYHAYVGDVGAAGTYAMGMTAPGSQTWVLAGIEIQGSSGVTQAIGVAVETDSARALGRTKVRAVGISTEADASQALGRRKTRALGATAVTETAIPIGRSKMRSLGTAAQALAARTLTPSKNRTLGVATEADAAMALTGAPIVDSVSATAGAPHPSWFAGRSQRSWSTGQPESSWQAGVPSA